MAKKQARETALRASEAQERSILNAIPQMVWSTRPDGYHDFYNERWYEFTGVPHGSTDGEGWNRMFHPDDRARAWSLWQHSLATGDPYEIEYRLCHHSGVYRWVLGRALPVRDEAGEIARWMGTCTDIDAHKRAGEDLQRTSALLRLVGDSTPDLIYAKDREGRVLYANAAVGRVIGRPLEEIVGFTDLDYVPDKAQARAMMANDRTVLETGETLDLDERHTDPEGRTRLYRSLKAPLRDESNSIIGIVGVTSDLTKRREDDERERLLVGEVDHRAKNMLAVVQSLVNLTKSDDPATFREAVSGRIRALGRAHDLLSDSRWEGVNLKKLVDEELAAFANEGKLARVAGPSLRLPPATAQSFGLVLHELATNALKYGALSVAGGRLELDWDIQTVESGQPMLRMTWREFGGPPVIPPASTGFGSALIKSSVQQLEGDLALDWRETGIVCEFRVPADQVVVLQEKGTASRPAQTTAFPEARSKRFADRRVLVVEDEILIAMEVTDMLREAGCEVVGPATSSDEAMRLIAGASPDAAVLDVNLGECGFSYDLADALAARSVPFAFCTGYAGASTLPSRFADAKVLAKPVDGADLVATVARLLDAERA